jgi:hypothetical protein
MTQPGGPVNQIYAVLEIKPEAAIVVTVHALLATASSASRRLVRTSRANGSPIGEKQMLAFVADRPAERTSVLLLNRPAQEACERAGLKLTVLGALSEEQLPSTRTIVYKGPFFFPLSQDM